MKQNIDSTPIGEQIISLLNRDNGISLRYEGIASRLNLDRDITRTKVMELAEENILFMQSGYYSVRATL